MPGTAYRVGILSLISIMIALKVLELAVAFASFGRLAHLEMAARPQAEPQRVRLDPAALADLKEMVAQRGRHEEREKAVVGKLNELAEQRAAGPVAGTAGV